jgi:hypothetical protein
VADPEDRDPETGREAGLLPQAAGRDQATFLVEGCHHRAVRLDPATSRFQGPRHLLEGRLGRAVRLDPEISRFHEGRRLLEGRLGWATFLLQESRRVAEGHHDRAVHLDPATSLFQAEGRRLFLDLQEGSAVLIGV